MRLTDQSQLKAIRRKLIYWCLLIAPFTICQFSAIAQTTGIHTVFSASERLAYVSGIDLDIRSPDNFLVDLKKSNSASIIANIQPLIVGKGKAIKILAYEVIAGQETFLSSMELVLSKNHKTTPINFTVALGRFDQASKEVLFKITDNNLNIASVMKATFYAENIDIQPQISQNGNGCDPLDVSCFVRNTLSELNPKLGKYSSVQENSSGGFDIIFALPKGNKKSSVQALDFSGLDDDIPNTNTNVGTNNSLVKPNSILASDSKGVPYWKDQDSLIVKTNNTTSVGQSNNNSEELKVIKKQVQDLTALVTTLNLEILNLKNQVSAHVGDADIHVDTTAPTMP